ncbi:AraC family transcriptional regulator [Vallitalea okinawensis]|uniref:AraC family transcriptional regulator n=1 Tax=Vallitalea okinawensis TaxID=2078660 RepID=UPI000CFD3A37|nr:AraC family transcriptional regulator [Vallitalea okinawensis]
MDYFNIVKEAIKYIENHLFHHLSIQDEISKKMYISKYHFHRVFFMVVNDTIGNYIKKRRFTEIAERIVNTNDRIIDIALDCQYSSHEAFTRAFKEYFGQTPSQYRKNPIKNPLLLTKKINDYQLKYTYYDMAVEPSIIDLNELKLIGTMGETSLSNNNLDQIWKLFKSQIHLIDNKTKTRVGYTVWMESEDDSRLINENYNYDVLVAVKVEKVITVPKEMRLLVINKGLYAAFEIIESFQHLYQLYGYIYFVWLKKSDYQLRDGYIIEEYSNDFSLHASDAKITIYVPVEIKQ